MSLQKNSGAVRRFQKAMGFAAWLQGIPNKATPAPFRLVQIGSQFWQSRVLYVAAELDIATSLADQTLGYSEIAERVDASPDAIHRILRMLAAMGIFEEVEAGRFRNNKTSNYLREDNPQSVRAMVLMHNSEAMSRPWYETLLQGVKEGEPPFRLAHGEALFDYMDSHPDFDSLFARAMDSVEALSGDAFATDFDWSQFDRIIDVGGSKGSKSLAILKQHPQLSALIFDRPQVIEGAADYWQQQGEQEMLKRMQFEAGDLLETLPQAQSDREIYLLCAVLHGMSDEMAVQALKRVAEAAAVHGTTIALMEMVMDEFHADLTAATFDMQMFMGTEGRERTLNEWLKLFSAAGLVLKEVVGLRSFGKILVLKAAGV